MEIVVSYGSQKAHPVGRTNQCCEDKGQPDKRPPKGWHQYDQIEVKEVRQYSRLGNTKEYCNCESCMKGESKRMDG